MAGLFDDLIPSAPRQSAGMFDDLIPTTPRVSGAASGRVGATLPRRSIGAPLPPDPYAADDANNPDRVLNVVPQGLSKYILQPGVQSAGIATDALTEGLQDNTNASPFGPLIRRMFGAPLKESGATLAADELNQDIRRNTDEMFPSPVDQVRLQRELQGAKGVGENVKAFLRNPAGALEMGAEAMAGSVPAVRGLGVIGGSGFASAAEGSGAGDRFDQEYAAFKQSPIYAGILKVVGPDAMQKAYEAEKARRIQGVTMAGAGAGAATAGITSKLGLNPLENLVAGKTPWTQYAAGAIKAPFAEGAGETFEEGVTQMATNAAADRPIMEGVPEAATQGGLLGFASAAPVSVPPIVSQAGRGVRNIRDTIQQANSAADGVMADAFRRAARTQATTARILGTTDPATAAGANVADEAFRNAGVGTVAAADIAEQDALARDLDAAQRDQLGSEAEIDRLLTGNTPRERTDLYRASIPGAIPQGVQVTSNQDAFAAPGTIGGRDAPAPIQVTTLPDRSVFVPGDPAAIRQKLADAGSQWQGMAQERDGVAGVRFSPTSWTDVQGLIGGSIAPTANVAPEVAEAPAAAPPLDLTARRTNSDTKFDERVHDLTDFIALNGGLDRSSMEAEGIDPANWNSRKAKGQNDKFFGKPLFRKTGGMTLETLREKARDAGFRTDKDVLDLISESLGGRKTFTPAGSEYQMALADVARQEADAQARQQRVNALPLSVPETDADAYIASRETEFDAPADRDGADLADIESTLASVADTSPQQRASVVSLGHDYTAKLIELKRARAAGALNPDQQEAYIDLLERDRETGKVAGRPMAGIGNKTAYVDALMQGKLMPVQAFLDADNFKALNDKFGHDVGDDVIRLIADVVRAEFGEGNVFHRGGDEFLTQGMTQEEVDAKMARVQDYLARVKMELPLSDGRTATLTGVGVSYGTGANEKAADDSLKQDKQRRKDAGLRFDRREGDDAGRVGSQSSGAGTEASGANSRDSSRAAAEGVGDERQNRTNLPDAGSSREVAGRRGDAERAPDDMGGLGSFAEAVRGGQAGSREVSGGIATVRSAISQALGAKFLRRLESQPWFHLVGTLADLPANIRKSITDGGNVAGFVLGNDVYIIADQASDPVGVTLHEVGVHFGMSGILGDDFPAVLRNFKRQRAKDAAVGRAYERATEAAERGEDGELTADALATLDEEALAYYVEANWNAKDSRGIVAKVIDAIKSMLNRLGIPLSTLNASPEMLRNVAIGAARKAADGRVSVGKNGVLRYHKAWHGSPHDFDKFRWDDSTASTGEGAQAYGYGLYFAGNKDVAAHYRDAYGNKSYFFDGKELPQGYFRQAAKLVADSGTGRALSVMTAKLEETGRLLPDAGPTRAKMLTALQEDLKDVIFWLESITQSDIEVRNSGKLYEVELAPTEDQYLDWDAPLSEQSEKVRAGVRQAIRVGTATVTRGDGERPFSVSIDGNTLHRYKSEADALEYANELNEVSASEARIQIDSESVTTGEQAYRAISESKGGDREASRVLHAAGIPGIRYLDGSSRNLPQVNLSKYKAKVDAAQARRDADPTEENESRLSDARQELRSMERANEENRQHRNYVIFDDSQVEVKAKYSRRADGGSVSRVIYRGTNDSGERIRGGIAEGSLFAAADEKTAQAYAGSSGKVERIGVTADANILIEGTAEFARVTGRRRGKLLYTMRPGENLKTASDDAAEKARAAGYDALEFTSFKDLGIVIFDESKFIRDLPDAPAKYSRRPDTIEVDGKQRPTTDSTGKAIHPTEEGVRNFWRWFSPSPSQLLDGLSVSEVSGLKRDTEALADFIESQAGLSESDRFAVIPPSVFAHVAGAVNNDEILNAVVRSLPVDVVDFLASKKLSPKQVFNDPAMLKDVFSVNPASDVALAVNPARIAEIAVRVVANAGAKISGVTNGALKRNAAMLADKSDPVLGAHVRKSAAGDLGIVAGFGDSKIIDAQGRPLLVYHGGADAVDSFDPSMQGDASSGVGIGYWFTTSLGYASEYAQKAGGSGGGSVGTFYISSPRAIVARSPRGDGMTVDGEPMDWEDNAAAIDYALRNGADGIYFKDGSFTDEESVVVFSPKQIKSAESNTGTFSPTDKRIAYSRKTPAEARAESAQKQADLGAQLVVSPGQSFVYVDQFTDDWRGQALKMRERIQDKLLSVRNVQRDIEKIRGAIQDAMNVYRRENLMHGRVGDQRDKLQDTHIKPLIEAMAEAKVSPSLLEDYLEARHAKERNEKIAAIKGGMPDGASGMTTQQAEDFLQGRAAGHRSGVTLDPAMTRQVSRLARKVNAITAETRRRLLDSGQITQETFDALENAYAAYVPLRGKDGTESGKGRGTGKGIDVRGKPIQRAAGRGEGNRAQNILAEVIADAERSIINAEKLRVGRTLARLVLENPNPDVWAIEPVKTELKVSDGTPEEIYEAVKNLDQEEGTIIVKVKGKPYRIVIEDQRMADALKNMAVETVPEVIQYVAGLNRYFSAVLTRYNPSFVGVNMTRDLLFGMTGIWAEHGTAAAAKAAASYFPAMRAAWRDIQGKPPVNAMGRYAREFAEAGGKTYFGKLENVTDISQRIGEEFKTFAQLALPKTLGGERSPIRALAKLAKNSRTVQAIEAVNEAVENALRLSVYTSRRQAGASIEQAAEYAKNISVNFNRRGSATSWLNALYLFFNAATQGAHRTMVLMKNRKVQIALGSLAALQAASAMLLMGLDDEDGEPLWKSISSWDKSRNLILAIPHQGKNGWGATVIKIPMPYGFNLFPFLGGRSVELAHDLTEGGPVGKTIAGFTTDAVVGVAQALAPLPFDDGWKAAIPTWLRIFTVLSENKDDLGIPVRAGDQNDSYERPRSAIGRDDTPRPFKMLSTALNRIGGGDDYTPPVARFALDWAPEDLSYLFKAFTGGLGGTAVKTGTLIEKLVAGVPVNFKDVPVFSSFVSNVDQRQATSGRYYDHKDTIEREVAKLRDIAKETGDVPENPYGVRVARNKSGGKIKRGDGYELEGRNGSVFDTYKDSEKEIGRIRDEMRAVFNDTSISYTDRIRAIDALKAEREQVQRELNVAMRERKRQ